MAAGGPSALLAEGLGCGSPPLLTRVLWCWWEGGPSPFLAEVRWFVGRGPSLLAEGPGWAFPRHSWLRALGAVPRHSWLGGPLVLVVGGPSRFLAEGPGCGSPPLLAGVCRLRWWPFPRGWAGSFTCYVCLWRGACWCVRCVFVVVAWVWVCLPCVLVRMWRVAVGFPGWGLLLVYVWVSLVCVVGGPSPLLAEVPECVFPPLLAGFRCRWWWVFLATPG